MTKPTYYYLLKDLCASHTYQIYNTLSHCIVRVNKYTFMYPPPALAST